MLVGQYLQNITKKVDMGAEILYQRGPQVPGNQVGVYTLAGRYRGMSFWEITQSMQVGTHCKHVYSLQFCGMFSPYQIYEKPFRLI